MLLEKGVPFNPDILRSSDWQDGIAPSLSLIPELTTTLRTGSKLKGVQIADTLILPGDVELTGDTIFLANRIIFEGKQARIHGLGKNVYFYPVASSGHITGTFDDEMRLQGLIDDLPAINERSGRTFTYHLLKEETSLEIDVSGQGHEEWSAKQREVLDSNELNRSAL